MPLLYSDQDKEPSIEWSLFLFGFHICLIITHSQGITLQIRLTLVTLTQVINVEFEPKPVNFWTILYDWHCHFGEAPFLGVIRRSNVGIDTAGALSSVRQQKVELWWMFPASLPIFDPHSSTLLLFYLKLILLLVAIIYHRFGRNLTNVIDKFWKERKEQDVSAAKGNSTNVSILFVTNMVLISNASLSLERCSRVFKR